MVGTSSAPFSREVSSWGRRWPGHGLFPDCEGCSERVGHERLRFVLTRSSSPRGLGAGARIAPSPSPPGGAGLFFPDQSLDGEPPTTRAVGAILVTRNVRDFERVGVDVIDPWSLGPRRQLRPPPLAPEILCGSVVGLYRLGLEARVGSRDRRPLIPPIRAERLRRGSHGP